MPNNNSKMLLPGEKINRLTIIGFDHKDSRHRRYYLCKCDCGTEKIIHGAAITSGNTKSCGCYGKEAKRATLLPENRGVINQIILGYIRHAKRRGLNWNLSYEEVAKIIQEPCFYCGREKSNRKITKNCQEGYDYNGIDRIDNSVGYEIKNTVSCCKTCNRAKGTTSYENFISWAHSVCDHMRRDNL